MKSLIHILHILILGLLFSCSRNDGTPTPGKGYFIFKVDPTSVSGGKEYKSE